MKVTSLFLYPVKSLAGIPVQSFELDDFGPSGDRRWMIVDEFGQFVTQRQLPSLALIQTEFGPEGVSVAIPGEGTFLLVPTEEQLQVTVWRDDVTACAGQELVNRALTRFSGQSLRFVYMANSSYRRVDPERVVASRRVGFADGFPVLLANQASLDELNDRLEHPVDIRRFRPNILVSGGEPWAEDHWRTLKIGSVGFSVVKPCSRCVMTTVDPDTGEKDVNTQPLRMLSTYRKTSDGVIFGQNAIHETPGRVAVGDRVVIQNRSM